MAAEPAMTDAQLTDLLLTPAEVGTGWTADTSSSGGTSSAPSCLKGVGGDSVADAEASYANGETAFAFEGLGAQATDDDAKSSWEEVTNALDTCTDLTMTQSGQTVSGTITANGEADFGDGAKSYTMTFTAEGMTLGIDLIVAYVGDVDLVVMYGTTGTAQSGTVDAMATAAIDKISSAQSD
jgi:hypothetical protein